MLKYGIALLTIAIMLFCGCYASAEVPDVSTLSLDELMQLQGTINDLLANQTAYTMLPGIYDCKKDFKWDWYNCKVLPAKDGTERKAVITFHEYSPEEDAFLTFEVSSADEGIKLSLLQTGSSAQLFMVIQGAPLEAVPFPGF